MSDKTLDKLIAQLKSEAIDSAEKASQKIVEDAKVKAQTIIKNAEDERLQMLSEAKKEAQDTISKGESALKQAARDLNVTVKNDLLKLFKAVFENEVEKSFSSDLIKTAVLKVIDTIGSDLEVKLPETMKQELVDAIRKQIQASDNSIAILKDKNLLNGLSITKTDQGWSYQITPEEVTELLTSNLSEKWINILNS
jgi:F0F1-type ATP synthase membrane subunit b/b'